MNYTQQGFTNFSNPLTAEQLILIEKGLISDQEALETCISTQSNTNWVDTNLTEWTIVNEYYWGVNHSQVGTHSSWEYIIIPVKGGDVYKINSCAGQNARQYYFYATSEPLADAILDYSNDSSTVSQRENIVTAPEGSVIMVVNHRTDGTLVIQKQIKNGSQYYFDLEKSGVNTAINKAISEISINPSSFDKTNILAGKVLVTVGDSITQGADMNKEPETELGANPNYSTNTQEGKYKTYGWQIAHRNGMIFYNKGISGSTMQGSVNEASDKGDISKKQGFSAPNGRYTQLPDEIDFLTIMFGWNDAAYGTLGTIDDTEPNTYYGGFNVTLPYLIYKYPYTTIILIVPFQASEYHRQAVRDLAKKWGVGCFDMMADDEPFYWGKEKNQSPAPDNTMAFVRRYLHQINGAHPGYQGHYVISTRLEDYMRRCGCYDRKNAIMWKVSYSTQYGKTPEAKDKVKVIYDDLIPALEAEGHTFQGWYYTDSEGNSKKAVVGTILYSDTVLYARWS